MSYIHNRVVNFVRGMKEYADFNYSETYQDPEIPDVWYVTGTVCNGVTPVTFEVIRIGSNLSIYPHNKLIPNNFKPKGGL